VPLLLHAGLEVADHFVQDRRRVFPEGHVPTRHRVEHAHLSLAPLGGEHYTAFHHGAILPETVSGVNPSLSILFGVAMFTVYWLYDDMWENSLHFQVYDDAVHFAQRIVKADEVAAARVDDVNGKQLAFYGEGAVTS
jgi:hypothetical protein